MDKGYRQDCANTFLLRQNENKKKSSLRNSSTRNSFEETSYSSDISWKMVQNTEQKYSVESVPWISGVFVFCVEPGPCARNSTQHVWINPVPRVFLRCVSGCVWNGNKKPSGQPSTDARNRKNVISFCLHLRLCLHFNCEKRGNANANAMPKFVKIIP